MSRCVWLAGAVGLGFAGAVHPPAAVVMGATAVTLALLLLAALGPGRDRGGEDVSLLTPFLLILLALLAGVSWGAVRVRAQLEGELASAPGPRCEIVVEVVERPRVRGGNISFAARSLGPQGEGERLLVEVASMPSGADHAGEASDAHGVPALREGSVVRVRGTLRAPESPEADDGGRSFDERAWLAREGIGVVLAVEAADVRVLGRRRGLAGVLDRVRERARTHLAVGIDPVTSSMLRGILLGDKADIPESSLTAFRRAGTAHLLAVSGLHVGALAAFVMLILRVARASPRTRTAAGSASVVLFALLTGAGPSVTRAAVMVITVLVARLVGRGRDTWAALGLAAVIVLAREPTAVTGPGFQLSFSAVAALLWLTRPLEERLGPRLPQALATPVAVSLAATIGTAPVSLLTFGQVSLVGVLANPLVVPVVPLIMALGLGSVAAGFVHPLLSGALNTAAGVLVGWVSTVTVLLARAPVMTWANAACVLMGAAGASLGVWAATRYRRGWGAPTTTKGPPLPALKVIAALVGAVVMGTTPLGFSAAYSEATVRWAAREWPTAGEARVLDVGEGSAVLVRSPRGAAVLIDGGPGGSNLLGDLLHLGVRRLDVLVVSHPHADHFQGLTEVVRRIPVGLFIDQVEETPAAGASGARPSRLPETGANRLDEAASYLSLRGAAVEAGARHVLAHAGTTLNLGDVSLEFDGREAPLRARRDGGWARARGSSGSDGPSLSSESVNASSLAVTIRLGGLGILVPGDAEAAALAAYTIPDIDCVVVPHHGSRGAVTSSFLRAVSPEVAVIPVGEGNPFGHPDTGTVETIAEAGVRLLRTDRSGWVAIAPSDDAGRGMRVTVEKVADGVIGPAGGRNR
ncbi:MAG: ComEC/Rec2 family competence protein [Thermoleophilia bacterium]